MVSEEFRLLSLWLSKRKVCLDHKALKTLMEAPLKTLSPRMLRACLELLQYRISYEWQPGRRMSLADTLGRRPVYKSWLNLPDQLENLQQDSPLNHSISNVTGLEPFLGVEVTASIKEAIKSNDNYQEILKAVGSYMRKDISNLPAAHPAKELASIWSLISKVKTGVEEDSEEVVLVNSSKLFVPVSQRKSLLNILHHPHQGINRTVAHAKRLFFWQGCASRSSS